MTTTLTPIKVPGKRKRDKHLHINHHGQNERQNQLIPGRPPKERPTATVPDTSVKSGASNLRKKRKALRHLKSRRRMAALELLPTELLEKIFLCSLDFNLTAASPIIAGKLSSEFTYVRTVTAAFSCTWQFCYENWQDQSSKSSQAVDDLLMTVPGDPVLQSAVLRCRWATLKVLRKAQNAWLKRSEQKESSKQIGDTEEDSRKRHHRMDDGLFETDYREYMALKDTWINTSKTTRPERGVPLVHPDIEIPERLLRGPWTDDTVKHLYWLWRAGGRVRWDNSTSGEVSLIGLREAIETGNEDVLYLFDNLCIADGMTSNLIEWTIDNAGGNFRKVLTCVVWMYLKMLERDSASGIIAYQVCAPTVADLMKEVESVRVDEKDASRARRMMANWLQTVRGVVRNYRTWRQTFFSKKAMMLIPARVHTVAMRSNLHIPVPSSALLKFLKSQSEELGFFSSNLRGFNFDHRAPRDSSQHSKHSLRRDASAPRYFTTTAPGHVTLEASFLNLDAWWPRTSSSAPLHQANRRQRVTYDGIFQDSQLRSQTQRNKSTDTRWWLRRLWAPKQRGQRPLKVDDLARGGFPEDGAELSMFNLGRSAKAANEPKLRCTEFDEEGNVVLVNGEFKKSELIAKYGLLPRDLRKIDSSLLPHILVRPSAILINLLHIRCLIKSNRILVFDAYGSTDSYTQSVFMYDLEGKLRQKQNSPSAGGLPYEFRALEAVLISVTSGLEAEFEGVREPVVRVLRELEEDITRDKLRHLLIYSKKLGTFEQKAKLVRDAIDELLDADDDLAAMYLTEKSHDLIRGEDDHTEVEMLLESYHKVCDEIVQEAGNLVSNIRNTEEVVKAILDANRNSLMLLDLKFSIGTLGIGSGAFVAAIYGMNLKNYLEDSSLGFFGVSAGSLLFAGMICGYGLTKLRKVQRVSMWGEAGKRGARGSWRNTDDDVAARLLEAGRRERGERGKRLKDERFSAMREANGLDDQRIPALPAKAK